MAPVGQMATVNALVPSVFNGNGEILLGDQPTRAGPDTTATGNTQLLIYLDHCVQFIVHIQFIVLNGLTFHSQYIC